ncbi:Protein kinase, ATP binding site-containing protein [Cynara cardunculus var. scolymus]|uniref:Protein kinase, ATP binding site-containing protein n=1 Tax=Cynara cardunculus var. scolymus TaxID=59895 RepID=A0A103Y6V3_CYNCS|nr:Protein kinase, ATP binding site-containing protein [Cynara cardunculus var. scolymus]
MGVCFSAQFKEKSPFHTGANSKNVNDLSTSSSSKVSSVPPTPRSEGEILQSPNLKSFSFSDLKMATRNFRPDSVLGEGGFGSVFKGWIDEQSFTATKPGTGIVIAVKKLNQESFQGGSELSWAIFTSKSRRTDWNYNAKLSDFGLAKDGPTGDKSHVSTRIMGTYGYAAPEYLATGHLTSKSDVYSFGVVLLEMLSGRRAVDKNRPSGEHNLAEWAKPYLAHKRKLFRVIDNRLEGQYTLDGAHAVANVSLRCLSVDPRFRPSMAEVVKELEQLQDPKGARPRPRRHSSHGSHGTRKSSSGDRNTATDGGGPGPQTQASI